MKRKLFSAGTATVSCSSGKKVLGCHIFGGSDNWKSFYPSLDGQSCNCYDSINGGQCVATCASGIADHEVVSLYGRIVVLAQCPIGKSILGCGLQPDADKGPGKILQKTSYSNLSNIVS